MSPTVAEAGLLAAGGFLVSEATGTTDFTSVGRSGGDGQQRPGVPSTPPTGLPPGLNLGELFSNFGGSPGQLISAFQAGADVAGSGGQGFGRDALIQAFNAGSNAATQGGQSVPTVEEIVDLMNVNQPGPSPGPSPNDGGQGNTGDRADEFRLQDLDGRGPGGSGTVLAALGESGVAVGETVGAVGDAVGSPGRPSPGQEDSFFGRIYQAGQTTGAAINTVDDAYDSANQGYRDATEGARDAVQTAKDVTRPWRWDVDLGDLNPVGTAGASSNDSSSSKSNGGRDSSSSSSPREAPTGRSSQTVGFDAGSGAGNTSSSGSGSVPVNTPSPISLPSSSREEKADDKDLGARTEAAIRKIEDGNTSQIGGL